MTVTEAAATGAVEHASRHDAPVLLAIDGNSLVHRSFHSQAGTGLRSPDGRPLWAIRGLLTQLVAAAERIGPAAIVVGFDDPDRSLRRDRWPQYKAGRTEKLDTLVSQLHRRGRGAARARASRWSCRTGWRPTTCSPRPPGSRRRSVPGR